MCRLLGIVASEPTQFALLLKEAPRSLAKLSPEHPDGWGIATRGADASAHENNDFWSVHRGTGLAAHDNRFHEIATSSKGNVLVAHIRQKTVGPTRLENTHPFERDGWVFAHNGTLTDVPFVRARCSKARLDEVTGDTDSEVLFALLLTRLDEAGLLLPTSDEARAAAHTLIANLTAELRAAAIGAFNFLLSDGMSNFAHRFGRSLFILERTPSDPVREQRDVAPGAAILTKWTARRQAFLVASERITDEPWHEIQDGTLLRIDRLPTPHLASIEVPGKAA